MSTSFLPRFVPPPSQDLEESGRLILRDGTVANLRLVQASDGESLTRFFHELAAEDTSRQFLSVSVPNAELISKLVSERDPQVARTLVVTRGSGNGTRIVATGAYIARDPRTAEVALAVADSLRGKGVGTLMLERLALLAVRNGFSRFCAVTSADNQPMRDVFRESGFEERDRAEQGGIEFDLSVVPTERSVAREEFRDRVATVASLRPFFRPNAVAVIGASRDPSSIGHRVLVGMVQAGYRGSIYPINPKATEIAGLKAYPSVRALPEMPELAVIAVPAAAVMRVVDDCAAGGVRALVLISAGFAEMGGDGVALQKSLVEKVRGYGMRMVGPNCLGLLNADPAVMLNASFTPHFPPSGRIGMSSQSGAVGLAVMGAASRYGLGFSTFVSVGNKADVSGNDLLQYWEEDPNTDVILLYLESFGNPRRFARIARRVGHRKPVVVLQSGLTRSGGRAAGSHTAALATNATAVEALFRQTGVVRAGSLEEMFDLALTLGSQPPPRGPRVAIVTNAGGPGILAADACEASGLTVPEVSPELRKRLATLIPGAASLGNPIDLIAAAGPAAYRHAIEAMLTSGEFDSLLAIYTPVGLAETSDVQKAIMDGIAAARKAGGTVQPALACIVGQEQNRAYLECPGERVPSYPFPETPARVLGKVAAYGAWRAQPPGVFPDFGDLHLAAAQAVCRDALAKRGENWLSAEESRTVLTAAAGLPLVPAEFARTADEAVNAAERLGFPVAVKLASRRFVHKSELGGVRLGLTDRDAVRRAFDEIHKRVAQENQPDAMDGVLVQSMLRGGVEVMAGVTHDPLFGPLIAFGLGGIHVEILADVCFRVAPLTDRDAAEMVRGIRGFRLLEGYRGHPPADVEAIQETLLRVSRLAEDVPEIGEIDLNPIFAFPPGQGCQIADARIRVRSVR
ncbi:MAG: GNAT family N-acetyltransferase [Planctomycetaceae bacterium]|nr:GNAT family N-acetyltransferase [Planctomycetaceae bacterium]